MSNPDPEFESPTLKASESDAVRWARRDKFIKDAAANGQCTLNVARTVDELVEQLVEDLRNQA
jgi:hypothetical protein